MRRLAGETSEVVQLCAALTGAHVRGLRGGTDGRRAARALLECVIGCDVAGPGKIERPRRIASRPTGATASSCCGLLMIDGLPRVATAPLV